MHHQTYLVHFNKNHNPKNGQFTYGDGDGDGKMEYRERLAKNTKSFNEMSRKEKKLYIKDRKSLNNEIINKSISIGGEYDKTPKGKKLLKNLNDSYDKYFNNSEMNELEIDDFDNPKVKKVRDEFVANEKAYLMGQGKYVAKQLIEEYGAQNVAELSSGWVSSLKSMEGKSSVTIKYDGTVDDLIEKYAEEAYYTHRE